MKKKILFIAAVVVCIAIAAAGTLAYFTSERTAHNVITTGKIDIEVIEKTLDEDGTLIDWPETGITGAMPGTEVVKQVRVKNVATAEAWVRVKLGAQITNPAGETLKQEGAIDYPIASTSWVKGADGYYYYTEKLAPGAETANLIEKVIFAPGMGNEYQNCTVVLTVTAEAVQVAHNGETVMEAAGWPESAE